MRFSIDHERLRLYEATAEGASEATRKASQDVRDLAGERVSLQKRISDVGKKRHGEDEVKRLNAKLAELNDEIAVRQRDVQVLGERSQHALAIAELVREYVDRHTPLRQGMIRLGSRVPFQAPRNAIGGDDA